MLHYKHILCLALLLISLGSRAGKRDSLKNIVEQGSSYQQLEAANDLAAIYETYKADSCLYFGRIALELAQYVNSDSGKMEAHYNIGLGHYQFKSYDSCVNHCKQALELSQKLNDTTFKGLILYKLSRAYSKMARYDLTIQAQLDAIRFYESQQFPLGVAVMYNNMSIAYKYLGDSREAIQVLQYALKNYRHAKYKTAYFTPLLNIGDNYYKLGLLDSGLIYLDSAILMAKTHNQNEAYLEAYINYWKGEIAFERGEYQKAFDYFEDSHKARMENYTVGDQVYTYLGMGRALHKMGKLRRALPELEKALEGATQVNAVKRIMMSHKALGEIYFELKNYGKAAYHQREQLSLHDSIFNQEKAMAIMNARTKFQVEAKDKEIKLLGMEAEMANKEKELATNNERLKDAELKQSRSHQLLLFLGLGFALLSIVGLFFVVQRRKKTNRVLSKQKEEISFQNQILEVKNKEITDSITYAKRIQNAILPSKKIVQSYLNNSFIFYQPKDIVAGDFYWMEELNGKILFAACDCTGHGVPGAMVSVVCNNGLNRSVREYGLSDPGKILDKTRELIVAEFEKSDENVNDGMDAALCSLSLNEKETTLEYAGAHNPLWLIRNGSDDIEEIKADKQPIGKYDNPQPYTTHQVKLNEGDTIYIFSDGYADQFGGDKGKKLKSKNFKNLILSIRNKSMEEQRTAISDAFEKWRGEFEQLDDVCVIGVRI
jgi:serine phosphatase RsbU (regulator of sigma subunit)